MNARLSEQRFEDRIGEMGIGESGYTVPWAMWPDMDGECWINGRYTIDKNPGGTVAMKVTRREDGYEVDITKGHARDYRWSPSSGDSFFGGAEVLPVVKVVG